MKGEFNMPLGVSTGSIPGNQRPKKRGPARHPFDVMGLKEGSEVWVRARVRDLGKKGTMGYAHGMLRVAAVTHGLNQDPGDPQIICTDVANVKVDPPASPIPARMVRLVELLKRTPHVVRLETLKREVMGGVTVGDLMESIRWRP